MNAGTRVIHKEKPEFGFGIVRFEEIDVLGDQRLHVVFDHLDHPLALTVEDLLQVPSALEDAKNGAWGDSAEFLRRAACALIIAENNHTGAFLRTTVHPLPHQVALLDKVLSGNRFGHLFADDVGLGKTIEAGLLITSILCSKPQARILVICPAGLALQWQEEMDEHFSLYFEILGLNFLGDSSASWRNHPLIIASIDRIKQPRYLAKLEQMEPFDLMICDEAHRLNAHRDLLTKQLKKTRNYSLMEALVRNRCVDFVMDSGAPRSPRIIFLSATPHQGDDLRFLYLLHILRPELFPINGEDTSTLQADRLREVMTRTSKSEARDWEGNILFKGHTVQTIDMQWSVAENDCSRALTSYISKAISGSQPGRELIVALVMHTFHKIAASSWSALCHTLQKRLSVLSGETKPFGASIEYDRDDFESSAENIDVDYAFYEEEAEELIKLIAQIGDLETDKKWDKSAELLRKMEETAPGERILFFTQFKQTQRYLAERISSLFPGSGIEIINGDVPLEERRSARLRFETESRFMISTEAGGEGVNLQKSCHIMVNYDWPWNPMRLQQRIGRLDRYGQRHVVRVFNLRVPDSWDQKISERINERLNVIQKTMGEVVAAEIEDYREMILGEVAEQIDPAQAFMAEVRHQPIDEAALDEKLKAAVASRQRWEKQFGDHLKPKASDPQLRPTLGAEHLKTAYEAALKGKNIKLQETRTSERKFISGVYHFELPSEFRDSRIRPHRSQYVAFDRDRFTEVRNLPLGRARGQPISVSLAGFGDTFTDWLFQSTLHAKPQASAFCLDASDSWQMGSGWVAIYCLRYIGAGRRFQAPDELLGLFLGVTSEQVTTVTGEALLALLAEASPFPGKPSIPPTFDQMDLQARAVLKERVQQRGPHAKSSPGLSLWALLFIKKGNDIQPRTQT